MALSVARCRFRRSTRCSKVDLITERLTDEDTRAEWAGQVTGVGTVNAFVRRLRSSLRPLHGIIRADRCKQMQRSRNDSGPASLMAGADPGAIIAVKVFVEKNEVSPVRIALKKFGAASHGPATIRIAEKNVNESP